MRVFKVLLPFILVLFLAFWEQNISVYAQDFPCNVYGDTVEVNLYNPHTYREGDKLMYQVEVRLKRVDSWLISEIQGYPEFNKYSIKLEGITLGFLWYDMCDPSDAIWKNFVGTGVEDWAVKWEWAMGAPGEAPTFITGNKWYNNLEFSISDVGLHCNTSQRQQIGILQMTNPVAPLEFSTDTAYLSLGTITWELQQTASGKVGVRFDYLYNTTGTCISEGAAVDTKESGLLTIFTGSGIVDLGGDLEPPVFAEDMDTVSCGRDFLWSWDYALDSENTPQGADTCIWFVKDVSLPIVAVDSGSKVTIEWPGAGDYTICAYSKNTTSGAVSDTIYQTVHIKNMPTADLDSITYACTSAAAQMAVTYTNLNPSGATTSWLDASKNPYVSVGGAATLPAAPNKVYYLALDYEGCQDTLMTETRLATPSVDVNRELTACGDTINLWVNSFVGNLHWLKEDRTTPLPGDQPQVYSKFGQAAKSYWVYADISNNGQFCSSDTFPVTVHFRTKPTVDVGMNGMLTSCDANSGKLLYSNLSAQATTHWLRQDYTVASAANENPFMVTKTNVTDYYYLAIEDASCGDTIPVSITFGAKPTADVALLQTSCQPDYGNLEYTSISGGTAKWYDPTYGISSTDNPYGVVANQSGMSDTYHLVITDGSCADTLDVTLEFGNRPIVNVTTPLTSCESTLTLSASSTDNSTILKWLSDDYTPVPSTTVSDAGTYYVYADGGSGCVSDTMSVNVELNSRPIVSVTDPLTSCDNQLMLTAICTDNNATLNWLKSDRITALPSAIVTASGTYYVYADGGTGCVSDTVAVNVQLSTKPVITLTSPLTSCGNSLALSATCSDNSASLTWLKSDNSILTSTTVSDGGTYYVYASGGAGCVSDTVSVNVELNTRPVVNVTSPLTSCDNSLTLSATCSDNSASLTWLKSDNSILTSTTVSDGGTYYVYASGGAGCVSDTVSVNVELNTRPVVNVTSPLTSCDNSLTLSATCSDNSASLTWLKSDNSILTSTTVSDGGTYYVYASGGAGCVSDTVSVNVELNTRPVVNVTSPLTSCDNSLTLSATCSDNSASLTWLKSDNSILTSTTVSDGGTYYVYASGGAGCVSDTVSVNVELNTRPVVNVTSPLTSCDNSLTLSATCSDNSASLTWLKSDNSILTSTTVSDGGTYYVYASGGAGCVSDTVSVNVELNTRPVVNVTSPLTSCDNSLTLSATCSDNSASLTWLKSDNSILTSTTVSDGGTYYVYASGGAGCVSDTVSVNVELNTRPVVNVTSPLTSCDNSLTLSATCSDNSASLTWLKSDNSILTSTTVSDGGTYYVYASGGAGCVSDTVSVNVELNTRPVVNVTSPLTSCDNSLTLSATCSDNSASLTWLKSDNSILTSTTVSDGGTYYVYASGGAGCVSDTVSVNVELNTRPVVNVTSPLTSCDNSLTLSATCSDNSASLTWLKSDNSILTSTTVSDGGTYYVYASGGAGCVSDTVSVNVELNTRPVVNVTSPLTSCDNSLTLSATCSDNSASLTWLKSDNSILTSTTVSDGGTYYVYASGGAGCVSDTLPVAVQLGTRPVVTVADTLTSCENSLVLSATCSDNNATLKWLEGDKATALTSTTVTTSGTYYVYALGTQAGCTSDTIAVNVQLGTKPLITVIDPQTSCGRSLTLTAISSDNSATLKWLESDKATALTSTTVTASGTYYVYALGTQAGCTSDTAVVNVQLGTKPTLDLQPQYTACGSDVKVSYSGLTDASAVVTWLDKDGATVLGNANPFTITNVIEDGTYYVSVLGSGCGDTLPIVVRPHTDPELSLNAGGFSSCTQDVTLSLTALSDLSATVYWLDTKKQLLGTGSPLTINEPVVENGIHYVVAVGIGSSCHSDTVPFNVLTNSVPVITAESLFTSCDTSVTLRLNSLSDAGATVKWLAGDMSTVVAIGNPVVTTMQANGTYYVYAEGASVGCNSDTLELEVKINTAPVITLNPDGYASCTDLVTLQLLTLSDWSARIEWLNAAGKVVAVGNPGIINDASDGQYKVRVTGQGCANPVEQTFNVKTGQNNLSLDIRPTWDNCNGNVAVSLSSLSDWGAVVKWFDGDGNLFATGNPMIISNAEPGKYSVMAQEPMNGCKSDTAHFVIVACDSVTDIIAVATPDTICTANSSLLSVTSPADYIPVSYAWSPSAGLNDTTSATPVFTSMAAGDYTFTVKTKDANGVEKTATVSIHVGTGQAPVLMDLDPVYCWGDSLKAYLAAGSIVPDSYEWYVDGVLQTGVTGEGFVMPATGVHHVKVVAVAGDCKSDIDTVTVDIHKVTVALPSVTQGPVPVGSIIQGTAQASGGTMPYVYEKVSPYDLTWFGADNNRFQFAAQAMAYHIAIYAVDDMGCVSDTVEHDITVTGYTPLDVDLNSQYGTVVCQDGSAILEATVSGGTAGYTYEWYLAGQANPVRVVSNAGSTDQLIVAPTAASSYYVNVKDNGNPLGLGSDTVQLTISPTLTATAADAGPDMTIASGAQTVLLGGGTNIQAWLWTPVNMLNSAMEADKQYPLTKVLTAQQEYLLYVTDDNNCVSLPDTAVVNVTPDGLHLSLDPIIDTLCLGNDTWMVVREAMNALSASATFSWTPAMPELDVKKDSAHFIPTAAGDYTFVVQVKDGSKVAALKADIHVLSSEAPKFDLVKSGTHDCQYDTLKVVYPVGTTNFASSYEWKEDGVVISCTDSIFVVNLTGQHTYEVTGKSGECSASAKQITVDLQPSPLLDLAITDSCGVGKVVATGIGATQNYTWSTIPAGIATAEQTAFNSATYIISAPGAYSIEVTASNGTVCNMTRTLSGEVFGRPSLLNWVVAPQSPNYLVNDTAYVSASVQATGGAPIVVGGDNEYIYHWFGNLPKDTVMQTVSSVYDVLVKEPANYTMKVFATDANGCPSDTLEKDIVVMGNSLLVTLTSPYGDQVCQGGAAMLVANAAGGQLNFEYSWYKDGTLVNSPRTNGLSDTLWVAYADVDKYSVKVMDQSGMVGADTIITLVQDPTHTAPIISAGPDMTIQAGNNTVLLGSITTMGTGGMTVADYDWHWAPATGLATFADTAYQYPQTKPLSADASYQLYVTDGDNCLSLPDTVEVIIDNVNGLCVKAEPETDTICLNNTVRWTAEITCGPVQGATYAWTPTDLLVGKVDTSSVVFKPMLAEDYAYAVLVTGANGKQAAARVNVKVNDVHAPLLALNGRWDCQNDTIKVTNTGESVTGYTWRLDGGSPLATTDSMLILSLTGQHTVMVYAEAVNGCVSDTVEIDAMIGEMPAVHILESSFAQYRDSVFTLHVDQTAQLLNGAFTYQWTSTPSGKIDGSDSQLTMQSKPLTGDVEYVFKASSTVNTVCAATDTVRAYIIPDSIALDIDKDSITGNILLKWDHTQPGLEQADSVRIMGVKWDGYAVATQYTPRAMALADLDKYLVDIANDTLEFFYANASRYIAELGQSYYSHSSDTVGYFRQWLSVSVSGQASRFNYISYPFDMTSKGLITSCDLGEYFGKFTNGIYKGEYVINSIALFDVYKQSFTNNNQVYILTNGIGWQKAPLFNLVPGDVYRVVLDETANDVEVLLYGLLPNRFSYDLKTTSSTNDGLQGFNYVLYPLSLAHYRQLNSVADKIVDKNSVAKYSFINQSFSNGNVVWIKNPGFYNKIVEGYGWMPLRVIVDSDNTFSE